MMDKIVVTAADIEKLLAWRDEHNDLVRSMPVPLREVEIQIVESGMSFGVKNVLLEERKAQAAGFAMDWTGLESAVRPRAGAMLLRQRRTMPYE